MTKSSLTIIILIITTFGCKDKIPTSVNISIRSATLHDEIKEKAISSSVLDLYQPKTLVAEEWEFIFIVFQFKNTGDVHTKFNPDDFEIYSDGRLGEYIGLNFESINSDTINSQIELSQTYFPVKFKDFYLEPSDSFTITNCFSIPKYRDELFVKPSGRDPIDLLPFLPLENRDPEVIAKRDTLLVGGIDIYLDAQKFYRIPTVFDGGGGSFIGFEIQDKYNSSSKKYELDEIESEYLKLIGIGDIIGIIPLVFFPKLSAIIC